MSSVLAFGSSIKMQHAKLCMGTRAKHITISKFFILLYHLSLSGSIVFSAGVKQRQLMNGIAKQVRKKPSSKGKSERVKKGNQMSDSRLRRRSLIFPFAFQLFLKNSPP